MRRLLTIALLTLWWSATMHCRLEAVTEILACDSHCHQDAPHAPDGCKLVEDGGYKAPTNFVKLAPPTVFICACLICAPATDAKPDDGPALGVGWDERPRSWVPAWQFDRRAAPLPGAPSLA
jgi:hypothetical protein